MHENNEQPSDWVQQYSMPDKAVIESGIASLFEEEELVMYGSNEIAELIDNFAGKEIDPKDLAISLVSAFEDSDRSRAVLADLSKMRRQSNILNTMSKKIISLARGKEQPATQRGHFTSDINPDREFDDFDYIFAVKHRFRRAMHEARLIYDTMIVDPLASADGHKIIDDAERSEIYDPFIS